MFRAVQKRATFYRGGTSRGLIFGDNVLAPYDQAGRDSLICSASSPDPDGRQIDGLGGGVSSLSKVAIVSRSGSLFTQLARERSRPFPGLDWLDDREKVLGISDVIYRFGQVSIKEHSIDWGSTCGNMVAAAAHFALGTGAIKPETATMHLPPPEEATSSFNVDKYYAKVRLLAHDSGKVVTAQVPVEPAYRKQLKNYSWVLKEQGNCRIAGVPGTGPGIIIESPLEGTVLSTGNERDTIEVDGKQIDVSIIDTGLPVIFVSAKALDIPLSSLLEHPATIDSNIDLKAKLERVRQKASTLTPELQAKLSPPAPKICVIHPRCDYITTGGEKISETAMDLMARVVSTGVSCPRFTIVVCCNAENLPQQLHRTIPATTLSALAASLAFPNSVVSETISATPCKETQETIRAAGGGEDLRAITVGQPAGCSSASVSTLNNQPASIVMLRTARKIIDGDIEQPRRIPFDGGFNLALLELQKRMGIGEDDIDKRTMRKSKSKKKYDRIPNLLEKLRPVN